MTDNIITKTDSYKVTHANQYPPNTTEVYSYFESRGGDFKETVFFGLQYYLKKYMSGRVVTQDMIDEADLLFASHFGNKKLFNRSGWEHILDDHEGMLPLSIEAVPEGSVIPTHNVLMTVKNTCPKCWWVPNYLETMLVKVWYPTTVATQSRAIKKIILSLLNVTGDASLADFKLHDFGYRGVSSEESAGIGGCAHLVNFKGTDTMEALQFARKYYNCSMAGFSIPAAEHSTMTSWGREHEADAMKNMLVQFPTGLVACVSDSFNIYTAARDIWGDQLRDMVLARDGTLVIRPDSGNPPEVVVRLLNILGTKFGYHINDKSYKVLNDKVRIIQGDGIDLEMVAKILEAMRSTGWSADNIAFGSGGALLQKLNRDTLKFAFKCSSVTVDGKQRDVWKEPITDPGKNSKRGKLFLCKNDDEEIVTRNVSGWSKAFIESNNILQEVYRDGKILVEDNLDTIRGRAII